MSPDAEIIERSLEIIAGRCEDLVPLVYQRFYASFPAARSMFGRDENNFHQGQMLNGMLLAIVEHAEGRCSVGSVKAWVMDHDALGVTCEMFPAMFAALFDTVKACMDADWNATFDAVWARQTGMLMARFDDAHAALTHRLRETA